MTRATTTLAWCGWRLRIPEEWRPLRLEGGPRKGTMMVGDATEAIFKASWARLRPAGARRWWRRRSRRGGDALSPAPAGFTGCLIRREPKTDQAVLSACDEGTGLLLELVYNAAASRQRLAEMDGVVLPSLRSQVRRGGEPARWAIFGAAFGVPAGYELMGQSLHLGEISLRFARRKDRLCVGQVYPAELALKRRALSFWLRNWPWEERALRRFRASGADEPWRLPGGEGDDGGRGDGGGRGVVETGDGEMADGELPAGGRGGERVGLIRRGRKSLRWPLRFLAGRRVLSVAVVDEPRGRILRAELVSPGEPEEPTLRKAILGMGDSAAPVDP
jgi:hypothetical protein